MRSSLLLSMVAFASVAHATIRNVGPGQTYATPCDAIAAAAANDEIDIAPGTYTDTCAITLSGLTLRGVGGRPKIDLSGTDHPNQYKGIYTINPGTDGVTIENLELMGAHITDANGSNGAAIRHQGTNLTVRNCYIHDNQDGILGDGSITVEYSEFFNNGMGNGCDNGNGCTHNIYMNTTAAFVTFQYNYAHRIATDTPDKGHLFKSRSPVNHVLYNRFSGEDGFDSYELDFPSGGLAIVVGNVIEKGANAGNPIFINWGEENMANTDHRIFVANNTFVNDHGSGTFINVTSPGVLTAHDNIFYGGGTLSNTGALSSDNWAGDPLFVNRAGFDYHLTMTSPVRGLGVAEGMADAFSLVPVAEYVHPTQSTARASAHDLGAFEFGTPQDGGMTGAGGGSSGAGGGTAATGGGSGSAGGGSGATGGGSGATGGGSGATGGGSGATGGGSTAAGGGSTAAGGGASASGGSGATGGGAGGTTGSCGCNEVGAPLLLLGLALLLRRRR